MKGNSIPVAIVFTFAMLAVGGCADEPDTADVAELPTTGAPASAVTETGATADVAGESALLNPNDATREEILAVDGMTEPAADAVLAGRPYTDMLAVDAVLAEHLTEDERETVYAGMWLPLDLNSASGEEILLIPGVGERMEHEFEEYRPYQAIEQFRREIGKYVDDEEVARLEQYVTIR